MRESRWIQDSRARTILLESAVLASKNKIEDQCQLAPNSIMILVVTRCISSPNLEVLGSISPELLDEQARKMAKFDFQGKFDLEGQGQSC